MVRSSSSNYAVQIGIYPLHLRVGQSMEKRNVRRRPIQVLRKILLAHLIQGYRNRGRCVQSEHVYMLLVLAGVWPMCWLRGIGARGEGAVDQARLGRRLPRALPFWRPHGSFSADSLYRSTTVFRTPGFRVCGFDDRLV